MRRVSLPNPVSALPSQARSNQAGLRRPDQHDEQISGSAQAPRLPPRTFQVLRHSLVSQLWLRVPLCQELFGRLQVIQHLLCQQGLKKAQQVQSICQPGCQKFSTSTLPQPAFLSLPLFCQFNQPHWGQDRHSKRRRACDICTSGPISCAASASPSLKV